MVAGADTGEVGVRLCRRGRGRYWQAAQMVVKDHLATGGVDGSCRQG